MGTGPAYMLASALFRMTRPPIAVGGLAMLWGYVLSMLQRRQRYGDEEFRRFLRRYQWQCLLTGKQRATRRLNERQASQWPGKMDRSTAGARAESTHSTTAASVI
jgi:hypothetical protein